MMNLAVVAAHGQTRLILYPLTFCVLLSRFQEVGECFDVADNRVARKAKRIEGTLGSGRITCATSVGDNHRNEAQVCCVACSWLNPNLSCDPDDGDRQDSAVAQRKR